MHESASGRFGSLKWDVFQTIKVENWLLKSKTVFGGVLTVSIFMAGVASSVYAWYKLKVRTDSGVKAAESYRQAAQAYDQCLSKQASGVQCSCGGEKKKLDESYQRYIEAGLDAGKAAEGVFPDKIPVGADGGVKRPWPQ